MGKFSGCRAIETQQLSPFFRQPYFWRTKQQQEIDYVEERDGTISGFEFKWNAKAKTVLPTKFTDTYNAKISVISKENFRDFVVK